MKRFLLFTLAFLAFVSYLHAQGLQGTVQGTWSFQDGDLGSSTANSYWSSSKKAWDHTHFCMGEDGTFSGSYGRLGLFVGTTVNGESAQGDLYEVGQWKQHSKLGEFQIGVAEGSQGLRVNGTLFYNNRHNDDFNDLHDNPKERHFDVHRLPGGGSQPTQWECLAASDTSASLNGQWFGQAEKHPSEYNWGAEWSICIYDEEEDDTDSSPSTWQVFEASTAHSYYYGHSYSNGHIALGSYYDLDPHDRTVTVDKGEFLLRAIDKNTAWGWKWSTIEEDGFRGDLKLYRTNPADQPTRRQCELTHVYEHF